MSRIIVEVWVPASGVRQDVALPFEVRLSQTIELIRALIADSESSDFTPTDQSVLCDAESGEIFNINLTPEELGLVTGARLMML